MLRRINILVLECNSLHTSIYQERTENKMHDKHRMHQPLADEYECHPENSSATDTKEERPVLQVIGSSVHGEYEMENEQIVERQHPL